MKIHSLSDELDEAKTTIRTLNKQKESDIVSDCFQIILKINVSDFVHRLV